MNNRRRMTLFNLIRGCAAILMALLVAAILIFISCDEPWLALRYLILSPVLDLKKPFLLTPCRFIQSLAT